MRYYDIHTHHQPLHPDDVAILNSLVSVSSAGTGRNHSVGIHPCYIYNVREQMAEFETQALAPHVVAIGECGLDKLAETPLKIQQDIFKSLTLFAERLHLPVIIHCVKAWAELIEIRKEVKPSVPWLIHGFRGKEELAGQLLRQGFYLSFGEYHTPDAVRAAWPNRIFAETDDKETDIRQVYDRLAETLSLPLQQLADQIEKNVQYVFPSVTVQ
jgi:TatD DNase family protein